MPPIPLLIIGAGPYGLVTAAYASRQGVACHLIGRPVEFWYRHMPDAMLHAPAVRTWTSWGRTRSRGAGTRERARRLQLVGNPANSAPWVAPNIPRANPQGM